MIVRHVPDDHVYVERIGGRRQASGSPWCPGTWPVRPDIVHVHFGFEHLAPGELRAWVRAVRRTGAHLVHTVHDIDNPHLVDQTGHHARLDVLLDAVDRTITLTPAAAAQIEQRWSRSAVVIPHPHVAPLQAIARRSGPDERLPALVWLGTLRPNIDLDLVESMLFRSERRLELVVRDEVHGRTDERRRRCLALLRAACTLGHVGRVTPRPTDRELRSMVAARPRVILPYAWGSHSGMVELCRDLGTPVVVPPVGCHADQGAQPDTGSTAPVEPVTAASRRAQRERVRREHATLYAELAGR